MGGTTVDRARLTTWLVDAFPGLLAPWLRWQRWYGGKGRTIRSTDVEDVLWLPSPGVPAAVVVLRLAYVELGGSPAEERFALVVALSPDRRDCPRIGRVDLAAGLTVVEATSDAGVLRSLLQGLATGLPVTGERGGCITYADATLAARHLLVPDAPAVPDTTVIGAEQSNSSVRVGPSHVFKLFRRLEWGENPQIEIERHLATRTGFRCAPALEGTLTYLAADGQPCTLGILESWVPSHGDGWSHVLVQLDGAVGNPAALADVARDAFVLGGTTADFHIAISSDPTVDAFAPERMTGADLGAWRTRLFAAADRVAALAEARRHEWPARCAPLADILLNARAQVEQVTQLPRDGADTCDRIRIHGDYHLGQTLKTDDGWVLIDFEGEPSRPLRDRREKQCALKDVAGMLRSFDYAVDTVTQRRADWSDDGAARDRLRSAFIDGYLTRTTAAGAGFVPSDPGIVLAWIAVLEIEKALYEVEYEAHHRPAWLHIPLQGLDRLLREGTR